MTFTAASIQIMVYPGITPGTTWLVEGWRQRVLPLPVLPVLPVLVPSRLVQP